MTNPTVKQKEEGVRERIWLVRNPGSLRFGVTAVWRSDRENEADIEYVRAKVLSSRDTEIREVLEGLRMRSPVRRTATAIRSCGC